MSLTITISGTYRDPRTQPIPGMTLVFESLYNSTQTQFKTSVQTSVADDGKYSIALVPNFYSVYERDSKGRNKWLGNIQVFADSQPGTLNEYLTSFKTDQAQPGILAEMEEILQETKLASFGFVTIDGKEVPSSGEVVLAEQTGVLLYPTTPVTYKPTGTQLVEVGCIKTNYPTTIDLEAVAAAFGNKTLDPGYSLRLCLAGAGGEVTFTFLTHGDVFWIDGTKLPYPKINLSENDGWYFLRVLGVQGAGIFIIKEYPTEWQRAL